MELNDRLHLKWASAKSSYVSGSVTGLTGETFTVTFDSYGRGKDRVKGGTFTYPMSYLSGFVMGNSRFLPASSDI